MAHLQGLWSKDPGHSAKSAGGRLRLNTHAPYVCGFARSDMVHGCMMYTERAETSCRITRECSESARERRIALYKSDQ